MHEFRNNEREISIPIVSERVQVNPDNSRRMSALTFLLFKSRRLQTGKNRQRLSQPKQWCNDSGVLNLHHGYYTTIMTPKRLFRHILVSRGTNQPIEKNGIRTVYEI